MNELIAYLQDPIHQGFRWVVVAVGLITLLSHLYGLITNDTYGDAHSALFKYLNLSLAIQFLLGLIVLIGKFLTVDGYSGSFGIVAGHFTTALVAIAAVGITSSRIRKKAATNRGKFLTGTIGLLIASLLIYLAVAALPSASWAFEL